MAFTYIHTPTTGSNQPESGALGTAASPIVLDTEKAKGVMRSPLGDGFILAGADGDVPYGFVHTVSGSKTADGRGFGGVLGNRGARVYAKTAGANSINGTVVMSGAQAALGTALTDGLPVVKSGASSWQIISADAHTSGSIPAGTRVLLEKQ